MTRALAALAVLLAALAFVACGDDNDSDSAAAGDESTSKPVADTEALGGAPFKLGFICSCTGAQASLMSHNDEGIEAWEAAVNDSGGLNGHPVEVVVKDDAGDPAKSLQLVKTLVEEEDIQAMVGPATTQDASWQEYISGKGIPVIGGLSIEAPYITDPNFFPAGAQLVVMTAGITFLTQDQQKSRLGTLYCAESPICAQLVPLVDGLSKLAGIGSDSLKVSATAPNYNAACQALDDKGVDALFPALNPPTNARMIANCQQLRFEPLIVGAGTSVDQSILTNSAFEGALMSNPNANPYDTSLPAVAEFHDALKKTAPEVIDSAPLVEVLFPWVGGKLFEAAVKQGDLSPDSTPDDIKQALYGLKDETLGGLSGPLNFKPDQPAFVPCYFSVSIKAETFESLNGNKPNCLTAEQVGALAKSQ